MLADGKLNESSENWLKTPLNPENLKRLECQVSRSLDFGWLNDALGAIARGAAMTVFLIVVTTLLGTVLSVLAAAGRRAAIACSAGDRGPLCRGDPQHAVSGAALLHLLRAAQPGHQASIRWLPPSWP